MAKISRPVLYTAVLGVAAYAVVLLTEPDAPAPKKPATHTLPTTTSSASRAAAQSGITPEDLKAHFKPYTGPRHDAFLPHIVSAHSMPSGTGKISNPLTATGRWVLTGISSIDGVKSALLENTASGTNVFLKVGDQWMGERVTEVGDTSIALVNAQGQRTELTFPSPEDPDKAKAGATTGTNTTPPNITVTAGSPNLMPLPVPPLPTNGGGAAQNR